MRPHRNKTLFSNYYLDELLPGEEEFKISTSELKKIFKAVEQIWDKERLKVINEDQLRKHFLDKVLDFLGWAVDVNAPIPVGGWSKRPDYALFNTDERLKAAQKGKKEDYYSQVICVGEAKRWRRSLDKKLKQEVDPFEAQNPALQISRYLWLTGVKWGILTDGKYWRLYERETSNRLDIFYEIDLEYLIEQRSLEGFRYFYLFFRREAFPEFVDKVYKRSIDYAEAVGEELKENIYQALKIIAQGFLKTSGNNLSEEYLKDIHDNSLILLYRFLFIFYAEHRGLLPFGENKLYTETYSLNSFKKGIANKVDKNEPIATSTFGYWNKLKELFEIINVGNTELGVPPYNGGLFEPAKHDFLEKYKVGDQYVAKAVDLLSRSRDKAHIDYSSLEIRHIGSVYEGLLEYKLEIAKEDLIPIKDKGKEIYISYDDAKKRTKAINQAEKVQLGDIYLLTDKGERKATGSFYTPDYVVKYIVENTLGPVVTEKRKKNAQKIDQLKERIKKSRGSNRRLYKKALKEAEANLIDDILSVKVLDPAMGSGHFLVGATDFLARELLNIMSGEPLGALSQEMAVRETSEPYSPHEIEEEDIRWARREVVERCIFGVDLNPLAVELAKLSLWLYTVAKNRPLNFLDHHLRCGNSLIGAKINQLATYPILKKKKGKTVQIGLFESIFKEKTNILLNAISQIEMLPSDTVEQIRRKEKLYQDFRNIISRFQDVADIWTSIYFANEVEENKYQMLQDKLRSIEKKWNEIKKENWFKTAKNIADERHFFHWELEFPEVFFEGHQFKTYPGFDAVIGNPPYVDSEHMVKNMANEREYISKHFKTARGNWDLYIPFWELSITKINKDGRASLITPNKWLSIGYGKSLRRLLKHRIYHIADFSKIKVFEDSSVFPVVAFVNSSDNQKFNSQIYTADYKLSYQQNVANSLFDRFDNWGIVFSENLPMIERILQKCQVLSDSYFIEEAFTVSEAYELNKFVHEFRRTDKAFFKFVITGTIDRYISLWGLERAKYLGKKYVKPIVYQSDLETKFKRRYDQAKSRKIIVSGIRYFESFLDRKGCYLAGKSTVIVREKNEENLELITLLPILNSKFMTFYLKQAYGTLAMDGGINFTAPLVSELPVPKISCSNHNKNPSNPLKDLWQRGEFEHIAKKIKRFPSDSPLLYDCLSFLSEYVIRINRTKYLLVHFIENKIDEGSEEKIEALKELQKIERKLPADIIIQREIAKRILKELEQKILDTDNLIDKIVYKLYDLAPNEIEIIENYNKT